MKKISGNIIFTLKCLLLVVHPTINFQAHISNYLFCRNSQTAHRCTEITAQPFWQPGGAWRGQRPWWAAPRSRSLLQLAKYCFMWKFQLIIYLTFKNDFIKKQIYSLSSKASSSQLPFSVMDKKRRQRHRLWHFSPLPPFPILWTIIFSFLSYVSVSRRTKLDSWLMTINNFIYTDPWCPHLWSEAMKVVDLSVMIKSAWVCHMWGTCELNSAF